MTRVLAISSSPRAGSFNRALLEAAARNPPPGLEIEIEIEIGEIKALPPPAPPPDHLTSRYFLDEFRYVEIQARDEVSRAERARSRVDVTRAAERCRTSGDKTLCRRFGVGSNASSAPRVQALALLGWRRSRQPPSIKRNLKLEWRKDAPFVVLCRGHERG